MRGRAPLWRELKQVPGWFNWLDSWLFSALLEYQLENDVHGDLLEIGVYKGKSAIHLASYLRNDEELTVCDLFEDVQQAKTISPHDSSSYKSLTQDAFETNFLRFHTNLPRVLRGLSSEIENSVAQGSCRFIHIDGSHEYLHVRQDASAAKRLLGGTGVVVFDDYRSEHTVGTAIAVWESVINMGLKPIAVSPSKLYGTWGEPAPYQNYLYRRIAERSDIKTANHAILRNENVIRVMIAKNKSNTDSTQAGFRAKSQGTNRVKKQVRRLLRGKP